MRGNIQPTENVQVAFHRNGVGGMGFHVVLGDFIVDGETRRMVVIRFPESAAFTW